MRYLYLNILFPFPANLVRSLTPRVRYDANVGWRYPVGRKPCFGVVQFVRSIDGVLDELVDRAFVGPHPIFPGYNFTRPPTTINHRERGSTRRVLSHSALLTCQSFSAIAVVSYYLHFCRGYSVIPHPLTFNGTSAESKASSTLPRTSTTHGSSGPATAMNSGSGQKRRSITNRCTWECSSAGETVRPGVRPEHDLSSTDFKTALPWRRENVWRYGKLGFSCSRLERMLYVSVLLLSRVWFR